MKKIIFVATSLVFGSTAFAAPVPSAHHRLSQSVPSITAADDYCDAAGRCCPIWLVDNGGFCVDAPIP